MELFSNQWGEYRGRRTEENRRDWKNSERAKGREEEANRTKAEDTVKRQRNTTIVFVFSKPGMFAAFLGSCMMMHVNMQKQKENHKETDT